MKGSTLRRQHLVDFLNAAKSRSAIARTIQNYRRFILGQHHGRSIHYSAIDALLQFRKAQPGGKIADFASLEAAQIVSPADLEVLALATYDENRVILPKEISKRASLTIGRRYTMYLESFPLPPLTLTQHTYSERQYHGLPEFSLVAEYNLSLRGPAGELVGLSVQSRENQGTTSVEEVLSFELNYNLGPGKYQLVAVRGDGSQETLPLSLKVGFVPYSINLGADELFALRTANVDAVRTSGGGLERHVTELIVLAGKRNVETPSTSRSRLKTFRPAVYEPSKLDVMLPQPGGSAVDFFTDVQVANFFNDRPTIVGISGKSQGKPDEQLLPLVRFYNPDGTVVKLQNEKHEELDRLRVQVDLGNVEIVDSNIGGFKTYGKFAVVFPQVSFLQFNKQSERAFVYFLGPYHRNGSTPSDKFLQLRTVEVATATEGDTIQRAMSVFGNADANNGDRTLFVLFNKGLVLGFDCLRENETPRLLYYNQVSDPNATDPKKLRAEADAINPGLDIALTKNKKGIYISSSKDQVPRLPSKIATDANIVGGRRYGLIYLYQRHIGKVASNRQSMLAIAHALPRKGADDGGGQVPSYKPPLINGEVMPTFVPPTQTTVTVYPPLGFSNSGFLRSQWAFKNDGVTALKSREGNGNETYYYRHFREAFRKGEEKGDPRLERDFFNGKGLQGGTPPRAIGRFGADRPIFFLTELPFLRAIPVRTFLIDSQDGSTILTMEDVVALDMFTSFSEAPILLAMRRNVPMQPLSMDKNDLLDYFKEFKMAAYQLQAKTEGKKVVAMTLLLDVDFGKEQPFFLNFGEVDAAEVPTNIGVEGVQTSLIAPVVIFQSQQYLLTALPTGGDEAASYHLYQPRQGQDGRLTLEKRFQNIQLPHGKCRLLRLSREIQAYIPITQAAEPALNGNADFKNDTVFVVERLQTNVGGQGERVLLLCKIGKDDEGLLRLIPGDLITDRANYS